MWRLLSIAALALSLSAGSTASFAQSAEELIQGSRNGDNVLNYGMGYDQHRYSLLTQINKDNVKKLVPVWNLSLENDLGEQGQPMVYNGVMYVADAKWTLAIEVATGREIWRTPVAFDPATPRVVCCGSSNRGVVLYHGKVLRGTLDAYLVALDQKTGQQIWKTKVEEWKNGFSIISAPQLAHGVLITGISGAEFGIRGFLDGYDPDTGVRLWRRFTIP